MNKYTVLVSARSFAASNPAPLRLLEEAGCRVIRVTDVNGLARQLKEADGVIAGLETYSSDMLRGCERLKVISRYGVGYDAVDIQAAREAGIAVTVTPGANSDSVADLAVALLLAAARHIPAMDASVRAGVQQRAVGLEMWQKTLGVIGTGRIGKGVVRRVSGFNMRLLCYDIFQDEPFMAKYGARYVDMDTLLCESDFITIHTPLTGETRGMIDAAAFAKMKSNAVFVNTARGGIVDEQALYDALKNGGIAAAALDATVDEPPYTSPLCSLANCILTPHIGAATEEAALNMGLTAVTNLLDVLHTGKCKNRVDC
jgi:D-3-phosphoglycerate dehydrogenase